MRLAILVICGAIPCAAQTNREPQTFFKEYIGLKDDEIASIEQGKPVAQILSTQMPSEIAVFGAIFINASPEDYLATVRNLDNLRNSHNYLTVRQISTPPRLSDFDDLVLDDEDIKDLRSCRPGKCQVQLPTESIKEFQNAMDWSAPDAPSQVNRLARRMAFEELIQYQKEGNSALGAYYDKEQPLHVVEQFETLVQQSSSLSHYLPDLKQYLIGYPRVQLPNAENVFYWEKVKFGLKPTLRMNHAVIYRGPGRSQEINAIAVKQLYASHYFQTAIDVSVCARDNSKPQDTGFYLITIKGSRQAGLTGPKGSIIRKTAVSRTRSSLESSLMHIKRVLETGQAGASGSL
jgi:hypothetical protein